MRAEPTPTSNRYAPPKASLKESHDAAGDLWRDGRIVVLREGSDFPPRCIRCNQPSVAPRRRVTLIWHSWGWYLLLPAILLYVLVAMAVRRRRVVHVGLCARHQRRVAWGRLVGWGGFAALVGLIAGGSTLHAPVLGFAALLLLLPWAVVAILVNRQLIAVRIDADAARLKGCGAAFLASLPVRPSS